MPLVTTDIKIMLTGGAGNTNPALSLGGVTSGIETGTAINNLFDNVSSAEAVSGDTEYRAVDILNNHATLTYENVVVYMTEGGSTASTFSIAYDSAGTQSVADENTAPTGVTFSSPTTIATAIALGNIAPLTTRRIWIKRIISAAAASFASDSVTLNISGDTA